MSRALINGRNFAHQDIIMNIAGVPMTSLSDVSVTKTATREFSYGTSREPVGYGDGRDEPGDVTFTLSLTDGRALIAASPDNDPTRLEPFNIPLTLVNVAKPTNIVIQNILIQSFEVTSDTDNKDIKFAITAQCSNYRFDTV